MILSLSLLPTRAPSLNPYFIRTHTHHSLLTTHYSLLNTQYSIPNTQYSILNTTLTHSLTSTQVDGDNSGAIDFLEFLLLAIPGMSKSNSSKKPRGFTVNPFRNAMFEDADGTGGEVGAREIEIPVQCFAAGEEDAVDEAKSKGLFAELRIRFKKNVHDNPGRSESARDGNIVLPLTLKRDCWVERVYPFNDKAPAQGSGGAGVVSSPNLC
jgi:hypothetical protein